MTGKDFKNITKISANQLTLPCKVLQNIISHIILPRKGHRDVVTYFELFILDSFLVGRELDFPTIALGLMKLIHTSRYTKALPYGMLLTKNFKHFNVSLDGEGIVKPCPIYTINIQTFKHMKSYKTQGQWVAYTKGFDLASGPSTLPFEEEEEVADEDVPLPSHPSSILTSGAPLSFSHGFTFIEGHFNLLNGCLDSLTSLVHQIQARQDAILAQQVEMQAQQNAFYDYVYAHFPPPPPPVPYCFFWHFVL